MLSIRRFLSRQQPLGDYDAVPLSDLQSPYEGRQDPPHYHQTQPTSTLTPRKVGLTILSTILVYTTFLVLFSTFQPEPEPIAVAYNLTRTVEIASTGAFYRDAYPIRSMLKYWEIAQREVKEQGLDTCKGQLSRELIDAYVRSALDYCHPPHNQNDTASRVMCAPVHHDDFSRWWPHPVSPCISSNLRPMADTYTKYHARSCVLTAEGEQLKKEMLDGDQKDQKFVGSDIEDDHAGDCMDRLNRTWIEIPRQDQWNPFHVGEDLVTTMVTVLIAARLKPELVDTRVQLVFADEYGMDGNHFTALWDRIGAWAPRRLVLDPWRKGECLGAAIHSVNAGASLLSAMKVNHHYGCASTITWGASHYYRHLVGLSPRDPLSTHRPPLNILWLSRAKYDAWSQTHDQWNTWKEWRHVDNEPELMNRIRAGLSNYCAGGDACRYEDGQDGLAEWNVGSAVNDSRVIRFHSIDPSVHAIENQLYLVGHSTILVSPHSGALGLTLFLPPGHGHVIELQVPATVGWHHYDIMATEMGMKYDMIPVQRTVDVDRVWNTLQKAIEDAIDK